MMVWPDSFDERKRIRAVTPGRVVACAACLVAPFLLAAVFVVAVIAALGGL